MPATKIMSLSGVDVLSDSSTRQMTIGSYGETADGRGYRYALVGAVSTVPGKVYQGAAQDTTNQLLSGGHSVSAAAIGDTTVTLTNSITLAADLLAGGYLSVNITPGPGQLYRIKGNTGVSAAAGMVITLDDPLRVALTTSSKVIFLKHPYSGVVVTPATETTSNVGVAHTIVTNAQYGFVQTYGVASVLFTGTGAVGKAVGTLAGGTIGSTAPAIAATPILGWNMGTSITGEYAFIYLTIH